MGTTANNIVKYRWIVIIGFVAVALLVGAQLRNARIDSEMKSTQFLAALEIGTRF